MEFKKPAEKNDNSDYLTTIKQIERLNVFFKIF